MTTTSLSRPKIIKFKNPAPIKQELDKRINAYFEKRKIKKTGDERLYQKTFILLFFYSLLVVIILGTHGPPWIKVIFWALLGFTQACIGFNIMHDACHGSYSSKKWVNALFSRSLEMMATSSHLWKIKHNVRHHSAPNTENDEDIKIPLMRVEEAQRWKPIHRYQHWYFIFLYSLIYFIWVFYNDFVKYFTRKIGGVYEPSLNFSVKEHAIFWLSKIMHVLVFVVFPWWKFGFQSWIVGYIVFGLTCGVTISVVFQLAHVVKGIEPVETDKRGDIPVENAVHQLKTTANFARKSRVAEFLFGGLNFQIEHHLYPKISHIHYFELSKIVKSFCKEHGLPYVEYGSFWSSLQAHIQRLIELGKKPNNVVA